MWKSSTTASDGFWWDVNQVDIVMDYWKEPGDITKTPIPIAGSTTNSNGTTTPVDVRRRLPADQKHHPVLHDSPAVHPVDQGELLAVYGSAVNTWTFHSVDFWDPERGVEGGGFGIYPMTKSFCDWPRPHFLTI
ncbi:MAG: hypothetical protein R2751_08375 [Bacteroidales bacterium]